MKTKTFDVTSGEVVIADPVHVPGKSSFHFFHPKAKIGRWVCTVDAEEKVMGVVINKMIAQYSREESELAGIEDPNELYHKAMAMLCGKAPDDLKVETSTINAESGMAGIFDRKSYRNDKIVENVDRICEKIVCEDQPWYSICCDRVLSEDRWGVIPQGCVSAAKDGVINLTASFNMFGEAERIEIDFTKTEETPVSEDGKDSEDSESDDD